MSSSESIVETFTGWAAKAPGAPLEPHSYDPGAAPSARRTCIVSMPEFNS
jgi:hypothetical protein